LTPEDYYDYLIKKYVFEESLNEAEVEYLTTGEISDFKRSDKSSDYSD